MGNKITLYLPTEIGDLAFEIEERRLLSLVISEKKSAKNRVIAPNSGINSKLAETVLIQLKNYFSSAIPFKTIRLAPQGTKFQQSVWRELNKIPLGETRTYGEIARKLNSSARAVGNACRRNPIAVIIPCHRVVSAKGLGGYAGKTEGRQLNIKRWLLNHEGALR
ncbi:MAG: hypothetical protein BMS9Abin31_0270 [Gammaproteobacteria bacterium]|nr:MAG: hypothetical protein BMS9Abin31_0270 [Gammaproteobacteria bacterium]